MSRERQVLLPTVECGYMMSSWSESGRDPPADALGSSQMGARAVGRLHIYQSPSVYEIPFALVVGHKAAGERWSVTSLRRLGWLRTNTPVEAGFVFVRRVAFSQGTMHRDTVIGAKPGQRWEDVPQLHTCPFLPTSPLRTRAGMMRRNTQWG